MKTAFFLAFAAVVVPMLSAKRPQNGLQCTTRWYGDLNIITRSAHKQIGGLALDYSGSGQKTLVIDEGASQITQKFSFHECQVNGWNEGGSFGVIQPGDNVSYEESNGCVSVLEQDPHLFVVGSCAWDENDTTINTQWFKVDVEGIGRGDYAIVEHTGGPGGYYYWPNAEQVSYNSKTAVAATREQTDQVLAFSNVKFVLRNN